MEISKKKKPRKPCSVLIVLALLIANISEAQTARDLMFACGVSGTCADTIVTGQISGRSNNVYLKWNNAANSATISALTVDATDDTVLNADTGDVIKFSTSGTPYYIFQADTTPAGAGTPFGAAIVSAVQTPYEYLQICGGGTCSAGNGGGASLTLFGGSSSGGGDINIQTGAQSGSDYLLYLNAAAGVFQIRDSSATPAAQIDGANGMLTFPKTTGNIVFPSASVITPSTSFPTPAAGDTLANRNTIIAAGAPTAAFVELPLATVAVGKTYSLYNQGSNPVAIVPISGNTQGVAAAATPFSCTTLKSCDCTALTTSNWMCGLR